MEGVIGSIVSKIDTVLIKLESMEKSKSKKRQNLSKMFEGLTGEAGKLVTVSRGGCYVSSLLLNKLINNSI